MALRRTFQGFLTDTACLDEARCRYSRAGVKSPPNATGVMMTIRPKMIQRMFRSKLAVRDRFSADVKRKATSNETAHERQAVTQETRNLLVNSRV
jgi:hypothetical protein